MHLVLVNVFFIVVRTLKVRKVGKDKRILFLLFLRFQLEDRWNEVGQAQQLRNDCIPATNKLQDALPTQVVFSQEVHPCKGGVWARLTGHEMRMRSHTCILLPVFC